MRRAAAKKLSKETNPSRITKMWRKARHKMISLVELRKLSKHNLSEGRGNPTLFFDTGVCYPVLGYPILSWKGIPILSCLGWGYSILSWPGYSHLGLGYTWKGPGTSYWDTPWKRHGTSGNIMGWRWGVPQKGHGTSGSIMGGKWDAPPERTWDQWKHYWMEMG